jgi:hypothetical protein
VPDLHRGWRGQAGGQHAPLEGERRRPFPVVPAGVVQEDRRPGSELHADLGVVGVERAGAMLAGAHDVAQSGSPGIEREQQLACPRQQPGRRPAHPGLGDVVGAHAGCLLDRFAGVHALGIDRSCLVLHHFTYGESDLPAGIIVVGGDRQPAQQVRPILLLRRRLVGHKALLDKQAGDVAEVRDDYVDQAAGHLVEIQRGIDLAEGVVKQPVPHHRWVEKPLGAGRRYAHNHQRRTAVAAIDGLDRDYRVDRIAALGLERQYGRGFPPRPPSLEQARQRRSRRTAHQQGIQGSSQQNAARGVQHLLRISVMPDDPSGRIYPENQRPHGGGGGKRSNLPHNTGLPPPDPAADNY